MQPIHDAHSRNAGDVRSRGGVVDFYCRSSLFGFLEPLKRSLARLSDLQELARWGVQTSFGHLKNGIFDEHQRMLGSDDAQASKGLMLFLKLARYMCGSMWWHVVWPGRLAVFARGSLVEKHTALALLREDYRAFTTAKGLVVGSVVLKRIVARSNFQQTLLNEAA